MKGKRFSVKQIVAVLTQAELGTPLAEFSISNTKHRFDGTCPLLADACVQPNISDASRAYVIICTVEDDLLNAR